MGLFNLFTKKPNEDDLFWIEQDLEKIKYYNDVLKRGGNITAFLNGMDSLKNTLNDLIKYEQKNKAKLSLPHHFVIFSTWSAMRSCPFLTACFACGLSSNNIAPINAPIAIPAKKPPFIVDTSNLTLVSTKNVFLCKISFVCYDNL